MGEGQGFGVSEGGEGNIPGKVKNGEECMGTGVDSLWPNDSVLMAYSEDGHAIVVINPTSKTCLILLSWLFYCYGDHQAPFPLL